ncbi:MAG: FkbM family methyltransferase [Pseudomonadota bacterium]
MIKLHWSLLKRLYRLRSRFAVYSRLDRRWLLDNRNWVDQQLIIRRPYEVEQIARCRQMVREQRLQAFFDIGANFGLYSVLLSDEAPLSEFHAFEPLPRNADQFGANLYLNGLDDRIKLHRCALSDKSGEVELYVDPHSTGVSTLLAAGERSRRTAYQASIRIEARVFDDMFPLNGVRAFVKMDVEGAELMVLAGMRRFFADNQVVLQVETTDETRGQVDDFMTQAGYRALGCLGADAYYSNIQAS